MNIFLSSIVLFAYLTLKQIVLIKSPIPNRAKPKFFFIFSLTLALGLNYFSMHLYLYWQDNYMLKGIGSLPPFVLMLILSDIIVELLSYLIPKAGYKIPVKTNIEIYRIAADYFMTLVIIMFFLQKYTDQVNSEAGPQLKCLGYELARDIYTYQVETGENPTVLSDFTQLTKNPLNGADLIYEELTIKNNKRYVISDSLGNELFKYYLASDVYLAKYHLEDVQELLTTYCE